MTECSSPFSARIASCRDSGWDVTAEAEATVNNVTVVPCDHGGLQLEMHAGGIDLEVLIAADGRVEDFYISVDHLQDRVREAE